MGAVLYHLKNLVDGVSSPYIGETNSMSLEIITVNGSAFESTIYGITTPNWKQTIGPDYKSSIFKTSVGQQTFRVCDRAIMVKTFHLHSW
jgi:hypothetical protein